MASEPIPEGYGQWTIIWSVDGNARELAVTCGYANLNDDNPAQVLTKLNAASTAGTGALLDTSECNTDYTVNRLYCVQTRSGILESGSLLIGAQGIIATGSPPVTTSIVVAKDTNRAGRQFRGRFAWPAGYVEETNVNNVNVIDPAIRTGLQDRFNDFYDELLVRFIPPVLLHSMPKTPPLVIPVPTPINGFIVRSQMGSDRKRLKRVTA